ncbi:MAG: TerB family tellurite resistance protein [Acidobacteria bacterium]|nr:TerB family tellurite resistance protein [Acidobacteriota bacterium]
MALDAIRTWLGLGAAHRETAEPAALRDLIDTLEHLEPDQARHLARFAYLLGRVAHADQHVSPEETRAMEALVVKEGGLTAEQAVVVVGLAKSANVMFGGTADFEVAREFSEAASYEEKLALARCLFRVAAADEAISIAEESEIHRIAAHLKILPEDLTALRVSHAKFLPGLSSRRG